MNWTGSGTVRTVVAVDALLKLHLYITGTTYDTLLTEYILVATQRVEKILGYPIRYPDAVYYVKCYECGRIILPPNVNTISDTKVLEYDAYVADEAATTKTNFPLYCELLNIDYTDGRMYKITASTTATSEALITQAIRMLVAQMYENRENKEAKIQDETIYILLADLMFRL